MIDRKEMRGVSHENPLEALTYVTGDKIIASAYWHQFNRLATELFDRKGWYSVCRDSGMGEINKIFFGFREFRGNNGICVAILPGVIELISHQTDLTNSKVFLQGKLVLPPEDFKQRHKNWWLFTNKGEGIFFEEGKLLVSLKI